MYIPIKTMKYFLSEFEKRLQAYSVEKKSTSNGLINIYLLNDSLALLVEIVGRKESLCCNAEEMYGDYRKNPYLGFKLHPICGILLNLHIIPTWTQALYRLRPLFYKSQCALLHGQPLANLIFPLFYGIL